MPPILGVARDATGAPAPESLPLEIAADPRAHVARLAELHDEARQTALLANLVGRTPYLAIGLAVAAVWTALTAQTAPAPLVTWLVLVGAGLVAAGRAYFHALAAPFERESLHCFSRDLFAITLYAGFAWGAGGILALSPDASVAEMLAFSAGASAFVAAIVRRPETAASFALPVTLLCSAAAWDRTSGGPATAAAVLAAGLLLVGIAYAAEALIRRARVPQLATLSSS